MQAVNQAGRTSAITAPVKIVALIRPLTAAENALLAKLPEGLGERRELQADPVGRRHAPHDGDHLRPGERASRRGRRPSLPTAVEAFAAPDLTSLRSALTDQITAFKAKAGACTTAPQQGTWNFTETPKVVNGQIVCYVSAGTSYLLWSYESRLFYIRISTPSPYADLLKYWQNAVVAPAVSGPAGGFRHPGRRAARRRGVPARRARGLRVGRRARRVGDAPSDG